MTSWFCFWYWFQLIPKAKVYHSAYSTFTLSTNEKKVKGHGWLTGLSRYNE